MHRNNFQAFSVSLEASRQQKLNNAEHNEAYQSSDQSHNPYGYSYFFVSDRDCMVCIRTDQRERGKGDKSAHGEVEHLASAHEAADFSLPVFEHQNSEQQEHGNADYPKYIRREGG